jgi:hypothetical protein
MGVLICACALAQTPAVNQARPKTGGPATSVPTSPDGRYLLQVLSATVDVHTGADPHSAVIAQLQQGARVEASQRRGNAYRVALADGRTGWVFYSVGKTNPNFSVDAAPGLTRVLPGQGEAPSAKEEATAALPPPVTFPDDQVVQQRPMGKQLEPIIPEIDPRQVPPPSPVLPRETVPIQDRWRIVDELGVVHQRWFDPYNPNTLKGDRPVLGNDWFFNLSVISDTLFETRELPVPIGAQSTLNAQSNDQFGGGRINTFQENLIVGLSFIKGDTTFRPPDLEIRLTPVFNWNRSTAEVVRLLRVDPTAGTSRNDSFVGLQEAFVDFHLRNVSDRYDFDSLRIGIQPFTSDFRSLVYLDQPLGIRLFGTRDNNQWQYNLGAFQRLEKDTNSGLNDVSVPLRKDYVFVANVYKQDLFVPGFTGQATILYNYNNERDSTHYDKNGFLVRPAAIGDEVARDYSVGYLGVSGDGHFGRWNFTGSAYWAFGHVSHDPIAQRSVQVDAGYLVGEVSRDFDWIRVRGTGLFATGDSNPFDGRATGFDSILENPQIAGAGTSYWIRQAIPLVGGGGVALTGRNAVLANLRSSQDEGQSNFSNPGTILVGLGGDLDLTPRWRLIGNLNELWFANTSSLALLRNQGTIDRSIGTDLSVAIQYRPLFSQNIVLNASAATLIPGQGLKELYGNNRTQYSILVNLLLTY